MEKPIMVLQKNTEKTTNKIRIPKQIVDCWGKNYYMKIYKDKIVLVPIDKEQK